MKRKLFTVITACALIVSLTAVAYAGTAVRIFYNGEEIGSNLSPINMNGSIFAPVRALAEAMGAKVSWNGDSNQVIITGNDQSRQIENLERALAPKSSLDAVNAWAEAVQTRNGAWQYALMTPELKAASYDDYLSWGWVTGTSSPWVKEFEVIELDQMDDTYRYEVRYTWTDSTNATSIGTEFVTVRNADGSWLISQIGPDIKGSITEVTLSNDNTVKSVFVKGEEDANATYDQAAVLIGKDTKIYQADTGAEMKPEDLKEGDQVEAVFKLGPMIMIYPPQAEASIVYVY